MNTTMKLMLLAFATTCTSVAISAPGDVHRLAEYQVPVMRNGYEVGYSPQVTGRYVNARKPTVDIPDLFANKLNDTNLFMRIPGSFFGYHRISLGSSLAPVAAPSLDYDSMGPYLSTKTENEERSHALDYFEGNLEITKNLKYGYPEGKRVVEPKKLTQPIAVHNAGLFIEGKPFQPEFCNMPGAK